MGDRYTHFSRHDGADGPVLISNTFSSGYGQLSFVRVRIQYGGGPWPKGYPPEAMSSLMQRDPEWQYTGVGLAPIFQELGMGGPELWFPHYFSRVTPYTGTSMIWAAHAITIPLWFLSTVTAVLPAIKLQRLVRTKMRDIRSLRWRRRGLCGSCGFDIRFSPERCPECGVAAMKRSDIL
jgi:hypothetical protein